jgi:hypothetical protein
VTVAKKSDIDCEQSQDLRLFHVSVAEARPFKDKERSFKPVLSSPAYLWDAKLTCCPKSSKAVGLRRLIAIITDGNGNPWKTQTPGCSSVVTVDDATTRGSPEDGIQYTTCSQHNC